MVKQTQMDFYIKKQATFETATYACKFDLLTCAIPSATFKFQLQPRATCLETMNLLLEVPIGHIPSYAKGIQLCHFTVSVKLAGIVGFYHINGAINPADILSKH